MGLSFWGQLGAFVAVMAAAAGTLCGLAGGYWNDASLWRYTKTCVMCFVIAMISANLTMWVALLRHDFSVAYVAQVGSLATPWLFTIVSLWSSLEGSILFWGLILAMFLGAFVRFEQGGTVALRSYAVGAMLLVASFFAFLIAGPATPFEPISPVPLDGPGPNPLLQNHPLMIIHPPMLYLGYVGMTVPFGMAIAVLLHGQWHAHWMRQIRFWMLIPWLFLSVGILLGSWWAYEVLGWGGYWAWDPVENASFLPWLAATSYLHATVMQERRQMLRTWTVALVLSTFLLTLLGTFMTRSGVFNSVHSFTQSPIGPVFLAFLAFMLMVSFGLLAGRSHLLTSQGQIRALWSRETAFFLNNLLFLLLLFTVLLGTLFPLLSEAIQGIKLSVGEPYFNKMTVPMGILLLLLMGIGPRLPWGMAEGRAVWQALWPSLLVGLLTALVCWWVLPASSPQAILTFGLCGFTAVSTTQTLLHPILDRARRRQTSWLKATWFILTTQPRMLGGYVVHLAIVVILAAVAASQQYRQVGEASLRPGETMAIGPYTLRFIGAEGKEEPHRTSLIANIDLSSQGQALGQLQPKLNYYKTQREPIGTPAVRTLWERDLYVSVMHLASDGQEVGLRVYLIPMVAWMWRSLPLLVLGALLSLWAKRPSNLAPPTAQGGES